MITYYSIIQKSQLEGALRLDAEYYQPEYLNFIKKFKSQKTKVLKDILREELFYGLDIHQLPGDLLKKSITSEILNEPIFSFDFGEIESEKIYSKYLGRKGDILFAVRGNTCGKVSILLEDQKVIIGNNIVVSRLKPTLSPFSVFAFLISKLGRLIIERTITGTAQKQIVIEELKNIKIPFFSREIERKIKDLIFNSFNFVKNSEIFYKQAENLLLEELGLKDFRVEDDLSYIVNLSQIKSAHRADAEYFQPKYEKLIKRIRKFSESLLEVVDNIPARFNPYLRPEETFKYVELEHINTSIGIIDGYIEILGNEAPSRAKRVLKEKDVIFSSVEGSLKKVALVNKEQEGYLASTGFFQFRCKKVLPEYFLVLAKSIVLQMQFEKETAGTILTAVPKEALKNIIIPILPKPTQQKIADLVQKSHEARKKAKELLEEAKQKVEELIEKDK